MVTKLNRKDIDYYINHIYMLVAGTGMPTRKPHRLLSSDELKSWEEKEEEKISDQERTGVFHPSF